MKCAICECEIGDKHATNDDGVITHTWKDDCITALREQLEQERWRKYPDEKPEIGQEVWIYWKDEDETVSESFRYSALFCEYCETFAPHFDGYSRCIHLVNKNINLLWKPITLPPTPEVTKERWTDEPTG